MSSAQRETVRKYLIRSVLEEAGPLLLEELRWRVLRREAEQRGARLQVLERSHLQSFARTAREHFQIEKLPITDRTVVGLVARAALYRVREQARLDAFLGSAQPTVVCQYRKNFPVDEPRYTRRYVTPQHHMLLFDFSSSDKAAVAFRIRIPATHELTLVSRPGDARSIRRLAAVRWRLLGRRRSGPDFPVRPGAALYTLL